MAEGGGRPRCGVDISMSVKLARSVVIGESTRGLGEVRVLSGMKRGGKSWVVLPPKSVLGGCGMVSNIGPGETRECEPAGGDADRQWWQAVVVGRIVCSVRSLAAALASERRRVWGTCLMGQRAAVTYLKTSVCLRKRRSQGKTTTRKDAIFPGCSSQQ